MVVIAIIDTRAMAIIYWSSAMCQALGHIPTYFFSNPQNNYIDSDNHFLLSDKETKT